MVSGAISAITGRDAAGDAADAQVEGNAAAIAENRRQFDQTREDFEPFVNTGTAALDQQRALLGLGFVDGNPDGQNNEQVQQQALDDFQENPAQRFIRERAEKSLVNNSAAIGGLGGGNVRSALVEQGAGFAAQDYNNYLNQLGALSGSGQVATGNVANLGAQSSAGVGAALINSGNAQATGIQGQNQAVQGFLGGITQAAGAFTGGGFI